MANEVKNEVKLEFGVYTDVTTLAKELDGEYSQYEKILICPDVMTTWVARILIGKDEEYNDNEDIVLIERNNLDDFGTKHNGHFKSLTNKAFAKRVLLADVNNGFENWDNLECDSVDSALESLDDGSGIIQEDGTKVNY